MQDLAVVALRARGCCRALGAAQENVPMSKNETSESGLAQDRTDPETINAGAAPTSEETTRSEIGAAALLLAGDAGEIAI
jgi:hypothetical protein